MLKMWMSCIWMHEVMKKYFLISEFKNHLQFHPNSLYVLLVYFFVYPIRLYGFLLGW